MPSLLDLFSFAIVFSPRWWWCARESTTVSVFHHPREGEHWKQKRGLLREIDDDARTIAHREVDVDVTDDDDGILFLVSLLASFARFLFVAQFFAFMGFFLSSALQK